MKDFDPAQPAILHERGTDQIITWTGEQVDDFCRTSVVGGDGTVEWQGLIFDGWGNVLGG